MASADDAFRTLDGTGNAENDSVHDAIRMDATEVERQIEAVIMSLFCFLALFGNISLWIIILRDRSLRNPSNALILCLSTADILVSGVNMPVIVYTLIMGHWVLSDTACQGLGFLTMLTFVASVISLGSISINRYIHICQHHRFGAMYTWRNTGYFILGTWLISICLSLPPLLGWATYGYLPGQSFCFCDWKSSISYTIFMVLVCFGGPCTAMSFCYVRIMQKVRESKRRIEAFTNPNRSGVPPPTPSGISSTSFSDSSNPKDKSVSQTPRSSSLSRRKRRRNVSLSHNGSLRSQRPISINSQTDVDTHFAPGGCFPSSAEAIHQSMSGKWVTGSPEDDTYTFPYKQMTNPRESLGAISDISHKVPFDENLYSIALDDGEYSICSESLVSRDILTHKRLPPLLGNVTLNSTHITEVIDDLSTEHLGSDTEVEPQSLYCSPTHDKSETYKYLPVINLRSPSARKKLSDRVPMDGDNDKVNFLNDGPQNGTLENGQNSPGDTRFHQIGNKCPPHIEVASPLHKSLEPLNLNNNSKSSEIPSGAQFLKPPSAQIHVLAEASRKSRSQLQAIRRKQDEIRMTISLLVVIFVFVICWFPFCIAMFWYVFSSSPVPRAFNMSTLLMGCMNSSCNPIIYGLMNRKFKKAFMNLYCACCLRRWKLGKNDSLHLNSS